jgi:O-antigen biosynthesis protein WbqP
VIKRLFDLCLVLLSGIPAVFLILLAAIFVWIETRVNPFFIQERVGQFGSTFKLLKLRTMAPNTANKASHEIAASQITNTGRFLRRTKIDELPQIWNVLLGDLSFVGPRPCLPSQTKLIQDRIARGVHNLRPGITGISQISGLDMSTPTELAISDALYCGAWSIKRDLQILIATVLGRGNGDAVK